MSLQFSNTILRNTLANITYSYAPTLFYLDTEYALAIFENSVVENNAGFTTFTAQPTIPIPCCASSRIIMQNTTFINNSGSDGSALLVGIVFSKLGKVLTKFQVTCFSKNDNKMCTCIPNKIELGECSGTPHPRFLFKR